MYQEVLVAEALQQVLKVMVVVIQVSGQSMMPRYLPVAILTPLPPPQVILVIQVVEVRTIICLHIWRFISGNGLHKDEIFGSNTYNAVLDYQRKNNLAADSLLLAGRWNSHEQANISVANGRWKQ